MAKQPLLDPIVIAQLGNLRLRARRILDGLYSGHHFNRNRGHAQDFSEHRPYNPGDDLRTLDWKVFGRTDKLVVRRYEEQTNVGATIVIDDSASMGYSHDGRPSKLDYAKMLAAAMGYLIVAQHDAIGLVTTHHQLAPRSQRGHLDKCFELMDEIRPQGVWNFQALGGSLGAAIKKRSFVLVFSDLMSDLESVTSGIMALNARRHEVLVFHVLDPAELMLPFDGPIVFKDLETGGQIQTDAVAIGESYRTWVRQHLAALEKGFRSSGVDYVLLTTDATFDKGLGAYLSWRGARI